MSRNKKYISKYDPDDSKLPKFINIEGVNLQQNEVLKYIFWTMGFGCEEQPFVWAYTMDELKDRARTTLDKTRTAVSKLQSKGYIKKDVRRPAPPLQHMIKEDGSGDYRMAHHCSHFTLVADHPDFRGLDFRGLSLPDAMKEKAAYAANSQREKREKRQREMLKKTKFDEDWAAFAIEMVHRLIIHNRELKAWYPGKYFSNDNIYQDFPDAYIKAVFGALLYRYQDDEWRLNHIKREFRYFCLIRQEFTPQEVKIKYDVPYHSLSIKGFRKHIFNSKTGECEAYFEREYYKRKAVQDGVGEVYFDECWEALEEAESKGFDIPDLEDKDKVIFLAGKLVQEGVIDLPSELKKEHYRDVQNALFESNPDVTKSEVDYEYSRLLLLKYTFYYDEFYAEMRPVTVTDAPLE